LLLAAVLCAVQFEPRHKCAQVITMNDTKIRDELKRLDLQRQTLEAESQAIIEELLQTPEGGQPIGIDTPLVGKDKDSI
jgi:hypothetical protein